MTQWDKVELMRLLKTQVDGAIKSDRLKPNDAMKLLSDYERLLNEYTYLSLTEGKPLPAAGELAAPQLSALCRNAVARLVLAAIVMVGALCFASCAGTTATAVGVTTVQDADAADKHSSPTD